MKQKHERNESVNYDNGDLKNVNDYSNFSV